VWTAAGLGAYLVIRDICNDDVLAKYRRVAHLQALALAALGATGLTMAHMLGFPSWTKTAVLLYGPLAALELLHILATKNCTKLNRRVNALTPVWTLLPLQTHTRPLTQAAARPATRHAERTGATTAQKTAHACSTTFYAKPAHACGRTTLPVFNFNYVHSQN
jgi:hypothetical protein